MIIPPLSPYIQYFQQKHPKELRQNKIQNKEEITPHSSPSASNYAAHFMPLNFSGTKICNANLINKLRGEFIPAIVTKLDFDDDADVMNQIEQSWKDSPNVDYIDGISHTFKNKNGSFFTVSVDDETKTFSENIKSIIKTDIEDDTMFIDFLQSAPDIADNPQCQIKGAGELAMYTAVKNAKEKGIKKIELTSGSAASNTFYDKIGFDCVNILYDISSKFRHAEGTGELITTGGCYELPSEKFDSFINRVESKYNIKS